MVPFSSLKKKFNFSLLAECFHFVVFFSKKEPMSFDTLSITINSATGKLSSKIEVQKALTMVIGYVVPLQNINCQPIKDWGMYIANFRVDKQKNTEFRVWVVCP